MSCEYMTPASAARLIGVAPSTVYRWMNQGLMTFLRLPSGRIRIAKCDLLKTEMDRLPITRERYPDED